MLLLIYTLLTIFFLILTWCGITIIRRAIDDNRFQIILPAGIIFGIALYIFLINLIAHLIKGPQGFYIALVIEISAAILIKKNIPTNPIFFPKKRNYILFLLTLLIFIPFLITVSAQGPANTADSLMHYSLASVFARGDYPPHVPWQPDYISYYHLGVAEVLGAMRAITTASYELLFTILELVVLGCMVLILPWLYKTEKPNFLIFFATIAFGVLSFGSFWLAWPTSLSFPAGNLFTWLKNLPTLADAFSSYGTQTNLLSFMLFSHRVLALAFSLVILFLLLSSKRNYIASLVLITLLSSIALTDESTFVSIAPAFFIVSFFTIFNKSVKKFLLLSSFCFIIVILQGGVLSYAVLNPNQTKESDILIFPPDKTGPEAMYENYRTVRINSLKSTHIKTSNISPLNFFNIGIIWRIIIISLITLFLFYKYQKNKQPVLLIVLTLLIASLFAVVEFIVIVPKGYLHVNGGRFLGLSYYFSGLAIIYLIYFFWEKSNNVKSTFKLPVKLLKIFLIWTLLITIIPSLMIIFPLQSYNWYANSSETKIPFFSWIGKNIPQKDRILLLVTSIPTASANISLIIQEGAFTPIWPPQIRSFYGADTSPTFFDIFYTLNPSLIKLLKIKYLILSNEYISQLPKTRVNDLNNNSFFQQISSPNSNGLIILKVKDNYFEYGQDLGGTFTQLQKTAPLNSTYFIENPPSIEESIYRSTRLILVDRKLFFNKSVAFYNYQLDATLKYYGESSDNYDYLILGKNTNPKTVCKCETELFWSGLGDNIKLWKVN